MSYAIIRIQKMTIGTVKGIQIHDQREKEFSHTNPDIDFSKSDLNEDLYNSKNINYNQEIKNKIKELNLTRAVRKDAIVMCQSLITSDKSFFDKLSSQEQKQFFKDSFEFIKETYSEKNIISANVHYDEKTPHMHVNFVPITNDGRLCAKDLFKRVDLIKLHDNFSKHCKEHGYDLERGESKGDLKKHLSVEEFKIKTKKEELEKSKIEFNKADNELNIKSKRLKNLTTNISTLEQTNVKKSFIGSKVTLQEDDYNKILKLAEKGVLNETSLNELKRVNASLEQNNLSYHEGFTEYSNKYFKLKKEHKKLTDNVVSLIKEHKIMTNILDKHNLMPEFKNELKNEKETERISRKSKSEDLER
ncbi:plasmid recombination protein [Clostridium estertheticum]|uniref:Plasmid recombination protein n=1 Tax=Clostridium estertheticum TaxID=238834 RepID=A0A5N7J876_9CLOT|nr:MobV family relaxase [Clostridium estertheticum]MPQ34286.1 plasmid recombination protein [Clostridium estertheticum]MPQ64948.1 plasmid recombination protein [Clostridium estertheticum]